MDQADAMRRAVVLQERFVFPRTNFKLAFFLVMCNGIAFHGTFANCARIFVNKFYANGVPAQYFVLMQVS